MRKWKKCLAGLLAAVLCIPALIFGVQAYTPRLTAPAGNDWHYYSNANIYYASGYGMPNCTAYAYGRAYELLGYAPNVSSRNAGSWWQYNINNGAYPYGQTPALGAIACWDNYDNNTGHVAVVEKIENGYVTISQSNWGGAAFETVTIPANRMGDWFDSPSHFQGYIYLPVGSEPPTVEPKPIPPSEEIGTSFYGTIKSMVGSRTTVLTHDTTYDEGNNVYVDYLKNLGSPTANQLWKFDRQSDGSYKIMSVYDGKCLDIADASSSAGANVQTVTDNGNAAQRWYIYKTGHSYNGEDAYTFRGGCTECVLDVADGSTQPGANVQVYTANQSEAQQFTIQRYDGIWKGPKITVNESIYQPGEYQIVWDDQYAITESYVEIWQGEAASGPCYYTERVQKTRVCNVTLPAGTYTARVSVRNAFVDLSGEPLTFTVGGADIVPGDLDKDDGVTIADVMEACKVMARESTGSDPTDEEIQRGDLDGDGEITIADVMEICKILARGV